MRCYDDKLQLILFIADANGNQIIRVESLSPIVDFETYSTVSGISVESLEALIGQTITQIDDVAALEAILMYADAFDNDSKDRSARFNHALNEEFNTRNVVCE